jgi:hypothetical protein
MRRPFVSTKADVKLDGLAPAGFVIAAACVMAATATGMPIIVTCGREAHGPTDPHTLGEALDLAVNTYTATQTLAMKAALEAALAVLADAPFDVLYERPDQPTDARLAAIVYLNPKATGPHFHIQRRKGTQY